MVEHREPLEDLIHAPRRFTAAQIYDHNLNNLGLTEEDLVSYALVLGPGLK